MWGYFSLPILYLDRFIGRFDPSLDRSAGILNLRSLYLKPEVLLEDDLVSAVASAMRDFLAFHKAAGLVVEKSQPAEFGLKLEKFL